MFSHTVKDVFSRKFACVYEDDTLSRCLSLFKKKMPPVLAVLDNEGKYKGVIARRWIVRSRLDPSITKVKTLMRSVPSVTLHDSLSKAARLMIESDSRRLPVFSKDKLLGFVTDEDIIHGTVTEKWGNVKVEEIMTKEPFVVEKDSKLLGLVTLQDIRKIPREKWQGTKVSQTMTPCEKLKCASPDETAVDALMKMSRYNVGRLPVQENGRLVGIVTRSDIVHAIQVKTELGGEK